MLTLYHFGVAICAQKVRVALAEKALPWESRDVFHALRSPDYLKLNPGGYAPTLVHDGRVVTESRVINEYLEDAFPEPRLRPRDPGERARAALWTKQIDDSLHLAVFTLSFASMFRHMSQAGDPDRARGGPMDPAKRQRLASLAQHGFESVYVADALKRFARLIDDMEAALAGSAWLAGDAYSLADVDFTPYLQRLKDLGLDFLWEKRPYVGAWFDRVRARPSFRAVIEDWVSAEEQALGARNASIAAPRFIERLQTA